MLHSCSPGHAQHSVSELVEDIMPRPKPSVCFNERKIARLAQWPELGAMSIRNETMMQEIDQPADAPVLQAIKEPLGSQSDYIDEQQDHNERSDQRPKPGAPAMA